MEVIIEYKDGTKKRYYADEIKEHEDKSLLEIKAGRITRWISTDKIKKKKIIKK